MGKTIFYRNSKIFAVVATENQFTRTRCCENSMRFFFIFACYEYKRLDRNNRRWFNINRLFLQHIQLDVASRPNFLFAECRWCIYDLFCILPDQILAFFCSGRHMDDCFTGWIFQGQNIFRTESVNGYHPYTLTTH